MIRYDSSVELKRIGNQDDRWKRNVEAKVQKVEGECMDGWCENDDGVM